MNWNVIIGSKGSAHTKQRSYTNSYDKDKNENDVDRFIDYDPKEF